MNRLSSEELVGEIVRAKGRLALFLGAGASQSSGIPTAGELVEQWRKELHQRDRRRGDKRSYEDWLIADEQNYGQWLKDRSGDHNLNDRRYAYLFDKLEHTPAGRQRVIAELCEKARPQAGYYSLAHLIDATTINVTVTTNFDDLIADACFDLGTTRPQVSAHSETASLVHLTDSRPKIIKLHGDFLFEDLHNTGSETQRLSKGMDERFQAVLHEFGLVVVGYGGNDDSVMTIVSEIQPRSLFWCVQMGSSPNKDVQNILNKTQDGFLVEIEEFDEFMVRLFRAYGGDAKSLQEQREQRHQQIRGVLEKLGSAQTPREAVAAARKQLGYWDLISEGNSLRYQGDLAGAEAAYHKAIELDPQNGAAYAGVGLVLHDKGDLAGAEAAHRKAIDLDPKIAVAYSNLGLVLRDKGDLPGAEAAYRWAIELDPMDAAAYNNRGNVRRDKGDLPGAEAAHLKAIELNPKYIPAIENLGFILLATGHVKEALEQFKVANGLAMGHPNEVTYILDVGLSYTGLGDIDMALDSFRSWVQRTGMKLRADVVSDLRFMAAHGHKPAEEVLEALKKEGLLPPE